MLKGTHHTEVSRQKMSQSHTGLQVGEKHPMFGKHHSEESIQLMREKKLGKKESEETKQKISDSNRGRKLSLGACLDRSQRMRGIKNQWFGKHLSEEHKQKISKGNQGKPKSDEHKRNISFGRKGIKFTEGHRKNLSIAQKELWQHEDFAKKMIEKFHLKPNASELYLDFILQNYFPDEWQFVGDGKVILDGLCPDFICVSPSTLSDSNKKIIELFGEHCHTDGGVFSGEKASYRRTEQGRREAFAKLGYFTLIIWDHELADENKVIEKIRAFEVHQ